MKRQKIFCWQRKKDLINRLGALKASMRLALDTPSRTVEGYHVERRLMTEEEREEHGRSCKYLYRAVKPKQG